MNVFVLNTKEDIVQVLYRCVAFLIKSNQYNQTQLDSDEGVEPSQGWSEEMDSTWVKYMSVTAKGLNT